MPMPSGAATVRTWSRCSWTSQQVSCRVATGAPESSNWPPGSSVMLARPRWSAIGRPPSRIGCQSKRAARPSRSARTLRSPS